MWAGVALRLSRYQLLISHFGMPDVKLPKNRYGKWPEVLQTSAKRIVAELKDKAPALSGDATGTIGLQQELGEGVANSAVQDAVSALTNLGYSSQQASAAVSAALQNAGEDAPSATLIRLGLKELSS